MLSRLRPHLSYANVVSSLAIFMVLGGVSYAATQLPKNSVGAKQIRKGAVGGSELRGKAVTLAKLSRQARAALRGGRGPAGPQGPTGSAGAEGKRGPEGPPGLAGAPATKLFAAVSALGALSRGSGAVDATRIGEGTYRVTFDRDLSSCIPLASVGEDIASPRPASPSVTVLSEPTKIHVYIENADGVTDDRPFYLAVFC